MAENYLFFPGRHLINTRFQRQYLSAVLHGYPDEVPGWLPGQFKPSGTIQKVIFAITSSNQVNSRYNPVPFHIRAIGVDRFARATLEHTPFSYRIFGIPHYGHTHDFAEFSIKEVTDQSEHSIQMGPENTLVLCSTPEVISLYQALGYSIVTAELSEPEDRRIFPIDVVKRIGEMGEDWIDTEAVTKHLSTASASLLQDFPETPRRISRIYQDPLTNEEGSLTEERNYNTYARGMNEIVRFKFNDIRKAIRAGRIVDEGCADGALLAVISQEFKDSDLIGVDISAEFSQRFKERHRCGDFGGAYAHFVLRNLLDPIFQPESIDTTICNSTLHELWSYGKQRDSIKAYLKNKLEQLRPGGHLVIRDVVGPKHPDRKVLMQLATEDGKSLASIESRPQFDQRPGRLLEQLSTTARFHLFCEDFLAEERDRRPETSVDATLVELQRNSLFELSLREAAEFLSKKDYTDNWLSEMQEEFCFWSFSKWKDELKDSGFEIIENPNDPESGSRTYTNEWIVKNRFQKKATLFVREEGKLVPIDYPPTNQILVARKPY